MDAGVGVRDYNPEPLPHQTRVTYMDINILNLLKAAVLGIVEGLTEFLPISSTGHLILAGNALGYYDAFYEVFEIVTQLAAILAVCWHYRTKLTQSAIGTLKREPTATRFYVMLLVAFLPALFIGAVFAHKIKEVLFNPTIVATTLIIGGFAIIAIERWRGGRSTGEEIDDMKPLTALKIGFAQALAMIPGTSRSGATIMGGMMFGLSRSAVTEFSFFLAIPTMFAATVKDVWDSWGTAALPLDRMPELAIGCITAFISAMWAVRFLLRFISTHTFIPFAYYRIVLGVIVFAVMFTVGDKVHWTPDEAPVPTSVVVPVEAPVPTPVPVPAS